jgi:chromosome segregation ATPase
VSDLPGDGPTYTLLATAGAVGIWLWTTVTKLYDKDRADQRARVVELEKENKTLQHQIVELSGTSGGATASAMQMQQRLLAVEKALKEAEEDRENIQAEYDNAECCMDYLTIHFVKMAFLLDKLRTDCPTDPRFAEVSVDLPAILSELSERRNKGAHDKQYQALPLSLYHTKKVR